MAGELLILLNITGNFYGKKTLQLFYFFDSKLGYFCNKFKRGAFFF